VSRMRATDHAEAAAEAIRSVNHATIWPDSADDYEWPADVDAVVSSLELTAGRSSQALEQAARWLERASEAGRVGHDKDGDVRETVATAGVLLRFAASRAECLARDLAGVRQLTSHLTGILTDTQPTTGAGASSGAGG
jgi:hypothetical protein